MLATVFGPVTVRRLAFRAPGQPSLYPADVALSLPAGRHSHGLRRAAVREAVRGSYDAAKAVTGRRCGPVVGKRQMEQLVQAAAVDAGAFCAQRVPMPCTSEVLLVLSADGKGIVMRPDGLRPATRRAAEGKRRGRGVFRTRLASGEKPCRKRMATLACVYDAAPAPRRPHDVIAVPGGRSGARQVRRGPHATAKWLTGSVARDADEVIAAAFGQAEARDRQHARTWVVLVDGDCHQIELAKAEAARRKVAIHIVTGLACPDTSGRPRGPSTPKTIRPQKTGSPRRPWRCCAAEPGRWPGPWPRRPASTSWQIASERAPARACAT